MYGMLGMALTFALPSMANILTVIAVYRKRELRTPTNILIINLGIADLFMGITSVYYTILLFVFLTYIEFLDVGKLLHPILLRMQSYCRL